MYHPGTMVGCYTSPYVPLSRIPGTPAASPLVLVSSLHRLVAG